MPGPPLMAVVSALPNRTVTEPGALTPFTTRAGPAPAAVCETLTAWAPAVIVAVRVDDGFDAIA